MKISDQEIKEIHEKLRIHPLPDDYAALAKLREVFGDQTLYLTADGLHIWEYAEVAGAEAEGGGQEGRWNLKAAASA